MNASIISLRSGKPVISASENFPLSTLREIATEAPSSAPNLLATPGLAFDSCMTIGIPDNLAAQYAGALT
ncbi:unannotated protein [freshwater metagenome]|uniref:Unannotated protein n=1 Tax=freshwater metagenome TaxID=449393 RepID=A0A6J7PPZ3_9ZZZZ